MVNNRLQPLNLMDFTGGLNLRTNQFQLSETESPDMLNVDVDPRGGFYTRKGWQRWNAIDIVDPSTVVWQPRSAYVHNWANNDQQIYVANDRLLYSAGNDGVFSRVGTLIGDASPHNYDYAAWGDDVYIACGMFHSSVRRHLATAPVVLDYANWSEVDTPVNNMMPRAEFCAAHAGYLFCAVTQELGVNNYSRVRWSHPNVPDAWRADDYLDIDSGGGKITGLMSFRDHLLIFKTNSMWALYGYDDDSWQLIKVSISVGCPSIHAVTRSETSVFFFSASDRGGIYVYAGESPMHISENLRPAFEEVFSYQNVFVSWAGRRLWVSVPWTREVGSTSAVTSTFVFDPDIGNGAWMMYRSLNGAIGPVIDGSDVNAKYPLAAFWCETAAPMVTLDYIEDAYDLILTLDTPETFDSYYRTRWLHAGWPDRLKSWRRPMFICRQVDNDVELLVESYRDYNETTVHRVRSLRLFATGDSYWTENGFDDADIGGFDWTEGGENDASGRGANWGFERRGSNLIRTGSMGLARAVQMRVRSSPATPRSRWGVDAIVAKYVNRRFL